MIIVTKGEHKAFYRDHGPHVLDIRRTALEFAGYSVRYSYSELEKRYRVFVRLDKRTYRQLRDECLELAVWPSMAARDRLEEEIVRRMHRFQPYGPVREQFGWILRGKQAARPSWVCSNLHVDRSAAPASGAGLCPGMTPHGATSEKVPTERRRSAVWRQLVLLREHDREHRLCVITWSAVGLELD